MIDALAADESEDVAETVRRIREAAGEALRRSRFAEDEPDEIDEQLPQ
jgi:hypothetical protein